MKWCGLGMWACTWECTPGRALPAYHYLSSFGPRSKSRYGNGAGDAHPTHTLRARFQNLKQNHIYLIVLTELQKNYKLYSSIVIHFFSVLCVCMVVLAVGVVYPSDPLSQVPDLGCDYESRLASPPAAPDILVQWVQWSWNNVKMWQGKEPLQKNQNSRQCSIIFSAITMIPCEYLTLVW